MNRQVTNKKLSGNKIVTIGTIGTIAALIIGVGAAKSCNKSGKKTLSSDSSTTVSSTLEATTNKTTLSESSTSASTKYSLESIDSNYSSPTRDPKETNESGFVTNEYGEYGDSSGDVIEVLRETTPNDYVEVIVEPTASLEPTESFPEGTTTPTKETDINGTVEETTTYIEPTGTDPLPIEPTVVTIDLLADSEYKESNNAKQARKMTLTLSRENR